MTKEVFYKKYFKKVFELLNLNSDSILVITLSKNELIESIINEFVNDMRIKEHKIIYNNYEEKERVLLNKDERLLNSSLFDNSVYNVYAVKGAVFLYLNDYFEYRDEIDNDFYLKAQKIESNSKLFYEQLKLFNMIKWCAVFVPSEKWLKIMCEENDMTEEEIFEKLYYACGLDGAFEIEKEKIIMNTDILNKYNFDEVRFINSLGTDLKVGISNRKWLNIFNYKVKGSFCVPNFPSYEIYTTPRRNSVNGVIYSSKKIVYQKREIDGIYLKVENGKITEWNARNGKEYLDYLIKCDSGSNMLGEIAIVEDSSLVNKSNMFFHDILLDENASSHIAVGMGFLNSGENVNNKEDIIREEINISSVHMDIMIGTDDMRIYGCVNGKEYLIYENGKVVLNAKM